MAARQANNLPKELRETLARHFQPRNQSIRAYMPWRQALYDDRDNALHVAPIPGGPLTATVVGPDGENSAQGAGEIHTDRLGRIRIRFDFQSSEAQSQPAETSNASTWVRVMQRYAGAGMGWQFIPRVGQEVLVDFVDGSAERPIVIAALYNGQGEAGIAPTPGGVGAESDLSALASSSDHRPGAQGNLIGSGHSPAWHGAGARPSSGCCALPQPMSMTRPVSNCGSRPLRPFNNCFPKEQWQ